MKTNLWKMASMLMLGLAMTFVSCEKEKEGPEGTDPVEKTPEFPEKVIKTLEDGADFELTVNPNMDWEVALSGDTDWFKLKYNGEPVPSASGKAGEVKFTITSSADEADFDEHRSSLSMKMGGEEKVIAEFVRNGRERVFSAYPVNIVDGAFEYGDEGYVFSENESTDFAMSYVNSQFQTYIKVVANFGWRLKETPEWAESIEAEGRYVVASEANVPGVICLRGNNPKYPLGGAEGNLVFVVDDVSAEPVEKEIKLSLPKVEDVFETALQPSARFNKDGEYYIEMTGEYQSRPFTGSVTGVEGVKVYAVDSEKFYLVGSSNPKDYIMDWVNISLTDSDEENVLKDYSVSISVNANTTGENRSADIFVIPGTVELSDPESQIMNDDFDGYREEFLQYRYSAISQEGGNGGSVEGGLITADNDKLAAQGAKLESIDPSTEWIEMTDEVFGVGAENYYQLTVTNPEGYYNIKYEFEFWNAVAYEVGEDGTLVESTRRWCEPSESYLSVSLTEDDAYLMYFLVLQTSKDGENMENVAALMVTYDPEAEIGGGNGGILSFKYADYGGGRGCNLRKMSEAEDGENEYFWVCAENFYTPTGDYPIYELTYGPSASMPNLASTLAFDNAYCPVEADAEWLSFEGDADDLFINMSSEEYKTGAIIFSDSSAGYPMPQFAIVCVYDPDFE